MERRMHLLYFPIEVDKQRGPLEVVSRKAGTQYRMEKRWANTQVS
jgi:hypothetical protein